MSEKQISKAKVSKDGGLTISFKEIRQVDDTGKAFNTVVEGKAEVHPELLTTLKLLIPHLILITGLNSSKRVIDEKYIKARKVLDDSALEGWQVDGVSISGEDATEGVVLIGRFKSPYGKTTSVVAPFTFLNGDGGYPFKDELVESVQAFFDEADQYCFHDKYQPRQLALDYNQDPGDGR